MSRLTYLLYGIVVVALSSCFHLGVMDDSASGSRSWRSGGSGFSGGASHK